MPGACVGLNNAPQVPLGQKTPRKQSKENDFFYMYGTEQIKHSKKTVAITPNLKPTSLHCLK
jgi:hypothetical protein